MENFDFMSINRALAELKLLDKKINKKVNSNMFINFHVGKAAPYGYKSNVEFNNEAKNSLQSVKDLIERRNKIKKAIVASNAKTEVVIGSHTMTVAEAIDRKESIKYEKELLQKLRADNDNVNYHYQSKLNEMNERIDKQIDDINRKEGKATEEERTDIEKRARSRYEPHILDPINIKEEIEKLTEEINNFEMEVDFALTESNTKTNIFL